MPRPRQVSDAEIDAAARATFLALGTQAPVTQVAQRLGVSHTALLLRAGSKEQLLLRALCPGVPAAVAALEPRAPRVGAAAVLERVLGELLTFLEDMLPGVILLRASGQSAQAVLGDREPPPQVLRRLLAQWLTSTGRYRAARARTLAEALLSSLEAHTFNAWLGGQRLEPRAHRRFLRQLLEGLLPELFAAD
jgi:AcrR family transcriptional regulator